MNALNVREKQIRMTIFLGFKNSAFEKISFWVVSILFISNSLFKMFLKWVSEHVLVLV